MAVEINQLVGYAERRVDGEEESGAGFADGHCDDDARLRPSSWARRERFRRVRRKMGAVFGRRVVCNCMGRDWAAILHTAFLLFLSAATAWSIPDHLWRQSDPLEAGTSDAAKAGAELRPAAAKSE